MQTPRFQTFTRRGIHRLCRIFVFSRIYNCSKRVQNVSTLDGYRHFRCNIQRPRINFYKHLHIWSKLVRTVYSASVIRRLSSRSGMIRRWKVEDNDLRQIWSSFDSERLKILYLSYFYRKFKSYASYLIVPIIDSMLFLQDIKLIS